MDGGERVVGKRFVTNTTGGVLEQQTTLAVVGAVGAVIAFIATRAVLGGGTLIRMAAAADRHRFVSRVVAF